MWLKVTTFKLKSVQVENKRGHNCMLRLWRKTRKHPNYIRDETRGSVYISPSLYSSSFIIFFPSITTSPSFRSSPLPYLLSHIFVIHLLFPPHASLFSCLSFHLLRPLYSLLSISPRELTRSLYIVCSSVSSTTVCLPLLFFCRCLCKWICINRFFFFFFFFTLLPTSREQCWWWRGCSGWTASAPPCPPLRSRVLGTVDIVEGVEEGGVVAALTRCVVSDVDTLEVASLSGVRVECSMILEGHTGSWQRWRGYASMKQKKDGQRMQRKGARWEGRSESVEV